MIKQRAQLEFSVNDLEQTVVEDKNNKVRNGRREEYNNN